MDGCDRTLNELFDSAVDLHEGNIAVEYYDDCLVSSLTYRDVSGQASLVQQHVEDLLRSNEANSSSYPSSFSNHYNASAKIIGLFMEGNCFLPSIIIGIFRAGASYLPLNPLSPAKVVFSLIEATEMQFVLTTEALFEQFCLEHEFLKRGFNSFSVVARNHHKQSFVFLSRKPTLNSGSCAIQPLQRDGDNEKWGHGGYFNICEGQQMSWDIAYVLSTSGTTGGPKLVCVPHRCIVPNIIHLKHLYKMNCNDKVAMCSPLSFDPSVVEIFTTLSSGAALVMLSNSVKCNPSKLANILFDTAKVSVMQCTPTLFSRFPPDVLASLFARQSSFRLLVFGGEVCPTCKTLKRWFKAAALHAQPRIINLYGITEVSSWSTFYEVRWEDVLMGGDDAIPLGCPLMDTVLQVRSKHGEILCQISWIATNKADDDDRCAYRVEIFDCERWAIDKERHASISGFMWLGGGLRRCCMDEDAQDGVDSGLLMRNSGDLIDIKIAAIFFENLRSRPRDNVDFRLIYLGRVDAQIKRQGKRMNVLAVKQKLEELSFVSACHVMCMGGACGDRLKVRLLVAFIVLQPGHPDEFTQMIVRHMKSSLDSHYIPDHLKFLDRLPITCHGKVDEKVLTNHFHNKKESVNKDDDLRYLVMKSWCDVLNTEVDSASVDAHLSGNFIECGGDSLAAVKLIAELEQQVMSGGKFCDQSQLFRVIVEESLADVVRCVDDHVESLRKSKPERAPSSLNYSTRPRKQKFKPAALSQRTCHDGTICSLYHVIRRGNRLPRGEQSSPDVKKGRFDAEGSSLSLLVKWKYESGKCIDASPLAVTSREQPSDGFVIIGSHSFLLASINIASGHVNWQTKLGGRVESSACLSPCERHLVVGCYDHSIYVVDVKNGGIWWRFETEDQVKCSPCPGPPGTDLVFAGSHDRFLYCLNIQRRHVEWKYASGGAIFSSPHCDTIEDSCGLVYGCSLAGRVFCLHATDGRERWRNELGKPIFSSPAVCEAGVCVGCVDRIIYMLHRRTGGIIWKFETNEAVFSSPAVVDISGSERLQLVVCGSHDGQTYCLNSGDGSLRWGYPGPGHSSLPPVYATPFPTTIQLNNEMHNVVVTASTDGTIAILHLHDGRCVTKQLLPGHVFSSPIVVGQDADWSVLIGCRNDYLYCLRLS